MVPGLLNKRTLGDWIIKRKDLLQMGPGRSKPATIHQVYTRGVVTENEPGRVVALAAQTQQVFGQRLRAIQFAAILVVE